METLLEVTVNNCAGVGIVLRGTVCEGCPEEEGALRTEAERLGKVDGWSLIGMGPDAERAPTACAREEDACDELGPRDALSSLATEESWVDTSLDIRVKDREPELEEATCKSPS